MRYSADRQRRVFLWSSDRGVFSVCVGGDDQRAVLSLEDPVC